MTHLAQVAREFRIGLKLLAASLVIVVVLFAFFKGGEFIKNVFFPTPPPPPEEKFGRLPEIQFPLQNPQVLEYRINTVTGKLPTFDACRFFERKYFCQMKVYKVKKQEPSLIALKTTRNKVESLGYTENETKISEEEYQWSNSSGQTIRINIFTENFKIFSGFLNQPVELLSGDSARKEGAQDVVRRFLDSLNIQTSDIDQENSVLTYLKLENGVLTKAQSLNEANFARLDLFQNALDGHKIYYPNLTESLMYFIKKNGSSHTSIVDASFSHFVANLSQSSTYAIKTAEAAFEDLKRGDALIFMDDSSQKQIDITDVSLGYYVGEENQQYFLPIIVFKGKGFTAYVQALLQ